MWGRKHRPDTLKKLSEMNTGEKNPAFGKHWTLTPETRAKMGVLQTGRPLNPVRRARQSAANKTSPKAIAARDHLIKKFTSGIENLVGLRLRSTSMTGWKHQAYIPEAWQQGFEHRFDYLNVEKRIAIEVNGCYWHGCPNCYPGELRPHQLEKKQRDVEVATWAQRLGYRLIIVWEHGLRAPRRAFRGIDLVGELMYGGRRLRGETSCREAQPGLPSPAGLE
jgi:hypothetical protein